MKNNSMANSAAIAEQVAELLSKEREETVAEVKKSARATQEVVKKTTKTSAAATQEVVKAEAKAVTAKVGEHADVLGSTIAKEARETRDHVTDVVDYRQPVAWALICVCLAVLLFFGARTLFLAPNLLNLPGIYTEQVERDADGNIDPAKIVEVKDADGTVVAYEAPTVHVLTEQARTVASIWALIIAPLLGLVIYFSAPSFYRWNRKEE